MGYLNFIIFSIFFTISGSLFASDFLSGNESFEREKYEEAVVFYKKELSKGTQSPNLYNNLGKAYYEMDSLGMSVWSYQMGLKFDPSDRAIIANLEFLETELKDNVQLFEPGLLRWLKGMFFGTSQNFWIYISILFSLMLAGSIFLAYWTSAEGIKTVSYYSAWVLGILLIFAISINSLQYQRFSTTTKGVIILPEIIVLSNPTEKASENGTLHEGTTFKLINQTPDYYQIKMGELEGWVNANGVRLF